MRRKILPVIIVFALVFQTVSVFTAFAAEDANLRHGYYEFMSAVKSGYGIAVGGDRAMYNNVRAVMDEGAQLQHEWHSQYNKAFTFEVVKSGDKYKIIFIESGKLITAGNKGDTVVVKDDNGSENQLFDILQVSTYKVSIRAYDGTYLTISDTEAEMNAKIITADKINNDSQKFLLSSEKYILPEGTIPDDLPRYGGTIIYSYPKKTLYAVGEAFDLTGFEAYRANYDLSLPLSKEDFEFTVDGGKIYEGRPFQVPGYKKVVIDNIHTSSESEKSFIINVVAKEDMTASAVPSSAKVVVNGKEIAFDAYNIKGSNYFKIRDIAMVLKDSKSKFNIEYDGKRNIMTLVPEEEYTPVGGELSKGVASPVTAKYASTLMYMDDDRYNIKGYNINGNNYFGLRDLAKVVDIGIGWDNDTKCISVNGNDKYLTGNGVWDTFTNQRMTMVRGIRLGYCNAEALTALYGEPNKIISSLECFNKDTGESVGKIQYYVYNKDYKKLLICTLLNGIVVEIYSQSEIKIKSADTFYDEIKKTNYAFLFKNYDYFDGDYYLDLKDDVDAQSWLCFYTTNGVRALNGLGALTWSDKAARAAKKYSLKMAQEDRLNHTGSDGSTLISRMNAEGVSSSTYGENIGRTTNGGCFGYYLTNNWYNSSGHRKNMLSSSFGNLGVGMNYDKNKVSYIAGDFEVFSIFATQDFH